LREKFFVALAGRWRLTRIKRPGLPRAPQEPSGHPGRMTMVVALCGLAVRSTKTPFLRAILRSNAERSAFGPACGDREHRRPAGRAWSAQAPCRQGRAGPTALQLSLTFFCFGGPFPPTLSAEPDAFKSSNAASTTERREPRLHAGPGSLPIIRAACCEFARKEHPQSPPTTLSLIHRPYARAKQDKSHTGSAGWRLPARTGHARSPCSMGVNRLAHHALAQYICRRAAPRPMQDSIACRLRFTWPSRPSRPAVPQHTMPANREGPIAILPRPPLPPNHACRCLPNAGQSAKKPAPR